MVEVVKANPDLETLKLTLWIAGSIIALLMSVVAFFLRKQIFVSETLTLAINELTKAVTIQETKDKERHPLIDRRLNEHSAKLKEHGERIAVIETKIEIKNKEI